VAIWYLHHLVIRDPGFVSQPRSENGHALSVMDIALGRCKESEFCPYTEVSICDRTFACDVYIEFPCAV